MSAAALHNGPGGAPKPTTSFFLSRRPPVIRAGAGEEWEGRGANDLWTGVGGPRSHSFGLQTSSIILRFRSPFWHLGHKCLAGRLSARHINPWGSIPELIGGSRRRLGLLAPTLVRVPKLLLSVAHIVGISLVVVSWNKVGVVIVRPTDGPNGDAYARRDTC